ncbi:MAG: DUF4240 domain-containing protein [Bacteroidales bacterium]|nr:DUF4240 domain-containing protein [Bacteroidales bacterium]
MNELVFWEIIEQSKEESRDFTHQIELLINKLSLLEESKIIEFEYRFREALSKSARYNIMAAAKIVNDYVSDDSFLYFRCRLIAEGKELFHKAIENPEVIAKSNIQELEFGGEEMLYIADHAFIKKLGGDTGEELPRDKAFDYLNYDEGEEIEGEDWKEEELPFKYPELWKRYKNESLA